MNARRVHSATSIRPCTRPPPSRDFRRRRRDGLKPWHDATARAAQGAGDEECRRSTHNRRVLGFAECVALEDVEAILALDGSLVDGVRVTLRRPKDYDPRSNPLGSIGTLDAVRRRTRDAIVFAVATSAPTRMFVGVVVGRRRRRARRTCDS